MTPPATGMRGAAFAMGAIAVALGCTPGGASEDGCQIVEPATALPAGLEETSGIAVSRDRRGVLWTHNDSGGEPEVVAIGEERGIVGRVRVDGAEAVDWEDLALAPCGAGSCLYVADTGEGGGREEEVGIYRFAEPDPKAQRASAEYFPARYPGGLRDAEALFVLPGGEIFLITKGRRGPVELYRYPAASRAGETASLQLVRTLAPTPQPLEEQVTGASAAPSGDWIAIRSYKRLRIWRTADLLGEGSPTLTVDLSPLGEVQGEAVGLLDNGAVVLTSEGGFPGAAGTISVLNCAWNGE